MKALLLLGLLAAPAGAWEIERGEYDVLHSSGPLPQWGFEQLTSSPGYGPAFGALVAALPRANAYQRGRIARTFKHARTMRQLEPLRALTRDPDADVREGALAALKVAKGHHATLLLTELVADRRYPQRAAAAKALQLQWRDGKRTNESGRPLSYRRDFDLVAVGSAAVAALAALSREKDPALRATAAESLNAFVFHGEPVARVFSALLVDASSTVRRAAIYHMPIADGPLTEALAAALENPDEQVRQGAADRLRHRGDRRAFPLSFARAGSLDSLGDRAYALRAVGRDFGRSALEDMLAGHEKAATERAEINHVYALSGVYVPGLLEENLALLRRFASASTKPATRRLAEATLARRFEEDAATPGWRRHLPGRRAWLLAACVFSSLSGIFLFLCGWRLLRLRRLVLELPVSAARSVPMGLVAVRGRAEPAGGTAAHPATGAPCVLTAGAIGAPFWVVDEGGRVLVDPKGAALLSADGVVSPSEWVRVIGIAEPGKDGPVIRLPPRPRSWDERLYAFLAWLLLGLGPYGRVGRMLFEDPRRVLWVWDDAGDKPMGSAGETGLLAATFILGGAWLAAFFAAASAAAR